MHSMQEIYLHNTLTKKKEKFQSLEAGKVSMYSCGPTVYDFAHIGNFRTFVMSDLLYRVLRYAGYKVTKVSNITDVGHLTNDDLVDADGEDKILKKARVEKKDPLEIARAFERFFVEDETELRIIPPTYRPRATECIEEQIQMTQALIDNGYAYEVNGSVYFSIETFEKYGELSGKNLDDLQSGARIEINPEKKDPMDFALWKHADPEHLMQWDSPWGRGFPGWHIECSAMSRKHLGDIFDIHTGGEDLVFPHHECEIAQSECSCSPNNNGKNTVNYWLHTKHLLVDGTKMSKSKGNFYTIRDLAKLGWQGNEIRYLLIASHYRTGMNFTIAGLEQARASIQRLQEAKRIFGELSQDTKENKSSSITGFVEKFQKSLFDDLNTSDALAAVFDLIKWGLKKRDDNSLTVSEAAAVVHFLENDFDHIFDIFPQQSELDAETVAIIEAKITERTTARNKKDWARSDEIRDELLDQYGVELIDEKGETKWKVKS